MLDPCSLSAVAASLALLCPPAGAMPDDAYENAWKIWAQGPKEPPFGPPAGYDPAIHGQWQPPTPWPVMGIHGMVLADGRVLLYSYPADYPNGEEGSQARLWDPATEVFEDASLDVDIFCSSHSVMPDGRVLVLGGNDYECENQGRPDVRTYDPATGDWTMVDQMLDGRWYPTPTTLGDGRVIITSGLALDCDYNSDMELYEEGVGVSVVPEGYRYLQLFPRIHLLSTGQIAHVGPEFHNYLFVLGDMWRYVASQDWGNRWNGTSVLIPGRTDEVMVLGGDDPPTNTVEVIDFKDDDPQWSYGTPMNHARGHHDALILPDKTVFVMGGGADGLYGDPLYIPELYDPEDDTWTDLPPFVYPRMYHSTTLLLPDGRVLISGQDFGESYLWGEIYEPPYLFRGARPVIADAPQNIVYGQSFTIATPQATEIAEVALLRLSSNTHSIHFGQRYVGLEFATAEGESALTATMEPNENLAPPGFYMLFIVTPDGVPSEASIVRVAHPVAGDINHDGVVDTIDLLVMLGAWGPCPGCPADLTGDGVVNVEDLLVTLANWN